MGRWVRELLERRKKKSRREKVSKKARRKGGNMVRKVGQGREKVLVVRGRVVVVIR